MQPWVPIFLQGSEMRDALLGHLFGLAAVVRAGRVTEEAPTLRMAALLLKLAGKKVFLREVAASVLLQLAGESSVLCAGGSKVVHHHLALPRMSVRGGGKRGTSAC